MSDTEAPSRFASAAVQLCMGTWTRTEKSLNVVSLSGPQFSEGILRRAKKPRIMSQAFGYLTLSSVGFK